MKRIATAAVLAPLIACVVLLGPAWLLWLVTAMVAVLCFREYGAIAAAYGLGHPGPAGYAAGLLVLLLPRADALMITLICLLALALVAGSGDLSAALPRAGGFLLGVIYIFGPWRSALALHAAAPRWLFLVLAVNWLGDTAAYYAGRAWGRHKMAPKLSPAKTWEGCAASLAASVTFGYLFLAWAMPDLNLALRIGIPVAANVAGQAGDLAESVLKRGAGVKDSGRSLPGHGGWLDRVDGTLFALPVVHLILVAVGRAG
ncbi:MAG: phosphatidate cytidylyltransferase [Bryobacterales bacterium]|jgi:phosphatidate cytidylyltransferase|nr:phosphatidate cytidylyltransferase [Bryobacterales bacterium]